MGQIKWKEKKYKCIIEGFVLLNVNEKEEITHWTNYIKEWRSYKLRTPTSNFAVRPCKK